MKISIAMATYNGVGYLQEQLDSLAEQEYSPHEIVVCDDGSTDGTLAIVQRFADTAPFSVRIYRNEKNLGYANNFLKAARLCEGDWVAFCDQDDVWLPHKLADCSAEIEKHPNLVMVLQNAELCDENMNPRGEIFPGKIRPGTYGAMSQYGFWVWHGFLQTVSLKLIKDLSFDTRPPHYLVAHAMQSHDRWSCMIANALGGIAVVDRPAALFRRHEQALTGLYSGRSMPERLRQASNVGATHYRYFSEVACSSARYMFNAARNTSRNDWKLLFTRNVEWFQRLSDIHAQRAELYEDEIFSNRIRCYIHIWLKGGYIGPRFIRLGILSALKDASHVMRGGAVRSGSRW